MIRCKPRRLALIVRDANVTDSALIARFAASDRGAR
jgi:hypothetical protein